MAYPQSLVMGRSWAQEWHDPKAETARERAKTLRAAGLRVTTETSRQVTDCGLIRLTLLDARTPDGSPLTDAQCDALQGRAGA